MSAHPGMRRLLPQALILVAATGLVVAMLVLSLWSSWRQTLHEQQQRIMQLGEAVALHVHGELATIDRAVTDVADLAREEAGLAAWPGRRVPARVAALSRVSTIGTQYAVQDADGVIIAASGAEASRRVDLSRSLNFSWHQERPAEIDDALFIAPPVSSFARPDSIVVLSRAIRSDTGTFIGVASAAIRKGELVQELASLRKTSGFEVGVYHRGGFALSAAVADERAASGAAFDMATGAARGTSPITAREALVFKTTIPAYSLAVAVSGDVDAIARAWLERNRPRIAIYGGILVLALALNAGLFMIIRRRAALEDRAHASLEGRFRAGIDNMADGFSLWDRQDRLVAWNRRFAAYAPIEAEVLREGIAFSACIDHLAAGLAARRPKGGFESYVARRRGRRSHLGESTIVTNVTGQEIEIIDLATSDGGIVTIHRDVTAIRTAVKRAEASEALFRDGIESMGEVFMLWDADDRLIAWNQRTTVLGPLTATLLRFGLPFAEYIDRLEAEVLKGADDPSGVRAYYQQRRERRMRLGEPFESGLLDGRILSGVERATSDGGVVTVIRDATAERRAADRLAASEAQFRDFGEIASDWFWETGPDHRYTYYSRGSAAIAFDPDRIIGRTRLELVEATGMAPTPALRELASIMDRHEVFRGFVIETRHWHDKTPCVLEVSGKPLFDDAGGFLGYRGTGRDITLVRRQAVELERALAAERDMNLQQRRFVSIASHEFRTPLAVIDGATQRVIAKLHDAQPDVKLRLDRIRSAVSRMTEIIDRTLSSARMDDGRIEIQPRRIALGALLHEACDRQRQISPGFDIAMAPIAGDLAIDADPKLLDQVITNLLSNAVKYSGASRRVEVLVTEPGPAVEIAVRDYGIGVPEAEVPKLFTRFFRASTAEGISGTGIGLHLIRELVLLHGGSVDVVSQLGQGSTFVVRLPRRLGAPSAGQAAA